MDFGALKLCQWRKRGRWYKGILRYQMQICKYWFSLPSVIMGHSFFSTEKYISTRSSNFGQTFFILLCRIRQSIKLRYLLTFFCSLSSNLTKVVLLISQLNCMQINLRKNITEFGRVLIETLFSCGYHIKKNVW